jgi:hypothetical protein
MLHPKLQQQINQCLNEKTDSENITRLFEEISQTYYTYEKQLSNVDELNLPEVGPHVV